MRSFRAVLALLGVLCSVPAFSQTSGVVTPAARPLDGSCSSSTAPTRGGLPGALLTCTDGTIYVRDNSATWQKLGGGGGCTGDCTFTSVSVGTGPYASSGAERLGFTDVINARNSTNTGNVRVAAPLGNPHFAIIAASIMDSTLTVSGDHTDQLKVGNQFNVIGSTGNDTNGANILGLSLSGGNTVITTDSVADATGDGAVVIGSGEMFIAFLNGTVTVPMGGFGNATWTYVLDDLQNIVADLSPWGVSIDGGSQVFTFATDSMYAFSFGLNRGAATATHLGSVQMILSAYNNLLALAPNLQLMPGESSAIDHSGAATAFMHAGDTAKVSLIGTASDDIGQNLSFAMTRVR